MRLQRARSERVQIRYRVGAHRDANAIAAKAFTQPKAFAFTVPESSCTAEGTARTIDFSLAGITGLILPA